MKIIPAIDILDGKCVRLSKGKYNTSKIYSKNPIKGKLLLYLVLINLTFLSYLIISYMYVNVDFVFNLFLEEFNLIQPNVFQLSILVFLIAILLNFKIFRIFFKKLILGNFFLIKKDGTYQKLQNCLEIC